MRRRYGRKPGFASDSVNVLEAETLSASELAAGAEDPRSLRQVSPIDLSV